MFIGFVDSMDDQLKYPNIDVVMDANGTTLKRHVKQVRTVSCD